MKAKIVGYFDSDGSYEVQLPEGYYRHKTVIACLNFESDEPESLVGRTLYFDGTMTPVQFVLGGAKLEPKEGVM